MVPIFLGAIVASSLIPTSAVVASAAVVGAGAVYAFSGDDNPKQPVKEKRQVSEDYVMRQLNRAGKNLRR